MAALTGSERGLSVGSFLNDTVEAKPGVTQVSVVWQPYEDTVRSKIKSLVLHVRRLLRDVAIYDILACSP